MKKGFTLIEIMAVITLLFLITLAVVPSIIKQVTNKKDDVSDANLNLIYNAADLYVSSNKDTYKKETGNTYCITLDTLVKEELLNKNVINFTTGKQIPLNRFIKITVNSFYEYEYELLGDSIKSLAECIGSGINRSKINPVISSTNDPKSPIGGYVINQKVNVSFSSVNKDKSSYYIKTSTTGKSNIDISTSCSSNETTGIPDFDSCKTIANTKDLDPDTWYKVGGDIEISYTNPTQTNGTLEAMMYDGKNYKGASTITLSKVFYDSNDVEYSNENNTDLKNVKQALDYAYEKLK